CDQHFLPRIDASSLEVPFSMKLPLISTLRMESIVNSLNTRKSPGSDGIFLSDIKNNDFLEVLRTALNNCIKSSIFPSELKTSIVKPIFKNGKRNEFTNYRPIANLTTFDKIFEEHLNSEITAFLER